MRKGFDILDYGEMVEDEVDEEEVTQLPDKCQSLRQRSIRKRIETERNKHLPKQRKQRERPAPLSKYRRKTANARERQRMNEVNVAFDKLKESIPHHKLNQIDEKKDTKITTLRCAIAYINTLSDLLGDINNGVAVSPEYYFTDAELGIAPPQENKGRNGGGGGAGGGAAGRKRSRGGKNAKRSKKSTRNGGGGGRVSKSSPIVSRRNSKRAKSVLRSAPSTTTTTTNHKCLSATSTAAAAINSKRSSSNKIIMTTTPCGVLQPTSQFIHEPSSSPSRNLLQQSRCNPAQMQLPPKSTSCHLPVVVASCQLPAVVASSCQQKLQQQHLVPGPSSPKVMVSTVALPRTPLPPAAAALVAAIRDPLPLFSQQEAAPAAAAASHGFYVSSHSPSSTSTSPTPSVSSTSSLSMYPQQNQQLHQHQELHQQQQQQHQQLNSIDMDLVKPWKDPVVEDISDLILNNPLTGVDCFVAGGQGQGQNQGHGQQMDFASIQDFLGAIESSS